MYLYQFHVHTKYSKDSNVSLKRLYKKLKRLKIKGIAITDHNTIEGALKFKEYCKNEIDVIVGEEIMTSEGEIIGLFLKHNIPSGLTPLETIKNIKNQGGIVYIPHPFDIKRNKTCLKTKYIENYKQYIECIEVFNGRCINTEENNKSLNLCMKLNKIPIVGSDSHSLYEINYNLMKLNDRLNRRNFLEELKKGKKHKLKSNKLIHQYTKLVRVYKLVKGGKFNELFRIIHRKCKKGLCNTK